MVAAGVGPLRSRALGSPSAEPAEAGPSFLPMRVVAPEAVAPRTAPPIEIALDGGPTVRVFAGFDPGTLGDVLALLEGRRC